jgi:hypothetical protein
VKERLIVQDLLHRRSCVSRYEQLGGRVHQGEYSGYDDEDVQQSRDASGLLEGLHR